MTKFTVPKTELHTVEGAIRLINGKTIKIEPYQVEVPTNYKPPTKFQRFKNRLADKLEYLSFKLRR